MWAGWAETELRFQQVGPKPKKLPISLATYIYIVLLCAAEIINAFDMFKSRACLLRSKAVNVRWYQAGQLDSLLTPVNHGATLSSQPPTSSISACRRASSVTSTTLGSAVSASVYHVTIVSATTRVTALDPESATLAGTGPTVIPVESSVRCFEFKL